MSKNTQRDKLCRRFSALGFRQDLVHNLVNTFTKWSISSGPEWTISRLKDLKVYYIQRLAGNSCPVPAWVATNHKGEPSKVFGKVLKHALDNLHDTRKVQRALSALMVYSDLLSNQITSKQWNKFSKSVEKALPSKKAEFINQFDKPNMKGSGNRHLDLSYSFVNWSLNPSTREPLMASLIDGTGKTAPESGEEIKNGFNHPIVKEYFYDDFFRRKVRNGDFGTFDDTFVFHSPVQMDNPTHRMLRQMNWNPRVTEFSDDVPVGKIGFIQEAGYKLRSVANPHRIFQYLLDPLKKDLLKILSSLKSDCTHNQENGVEWAQQMLKGGIPLSSVDLSDATNNFPLVIQSYLLKRIYDDSSTKILDLFHRVSRAPWLVQDPETKSIRTMKWTVGQPLGLAPSFPSFALSHHAIMWGVISKQSGKKFTDGFNDFINYVKGENRLAYTYTHHYRILGDDIVMKSTFEDTYKKILNSIDIPVSADKTISSDRLAEFASRVITPDEIYIQNKWKSPSDRNFLALAKNLGPTSLGLLRSRQKKAVKLLCHAPEDLGGLGWNPSGLSYQTRYAIYSPSFNKKEEEIDVTTKEVLALKKISLFNGDDTAYTVNELWKDMATTIKETLPSDRKTNSESLDHIFGIKNWKVKADENLPNNLIIDTLRRANGDPRNASVLEHLEKSGVVDILTSCNNDYDFISRLIKENPQGLKDLEALINAVVMGNHTHLTTNSAVKQTISQLETRECPDLENDQEAELSLSR